MGVYDQLPCGSCQHHASKSVELTHTSMLALNEVLRSPPLWTPLSLSINRGLTHTSLLSHGGGQTLSSAQVPSDTTGGNESRVPASTACHHLFLPHNARWGGGSAPHCTPLTLPGGGSLLPPGREWKTSPMILWANYSSRSVGAPPGSTGEK